MNAICKATLNCPSSTSTISSRKQYANQIKYLEVDKSRLKRRTFNIASFSMSPGDLEKFLLQKYKGFEVNYNPDFRQSIAENWPGSINCESIKTEIGVKFQYNFEESIAELIKDIIR